MVLASLLLFSRDRTPTPQLDYIQNCILILNLMLIGFIIETNCLFIQPTQLSQNNFLLFPFVPPVLLSLNCQPFSLHDGWQPVDESVTGREIKSRFVHINGGFLQDYVHLPWF